MTKAPLTAYEAALRARMITAACTLAHHRATEAVKQALRARGRPQQYTIESSACWRWSMPKGMGKT